MLYNHLLATFVEVAKWGSFNQAAQKLFISPTAVMKQINLLERQLDLILFRRTNQGLRLTSAGMSIFEDGKNLMAYSDKAIENARGLIVDTETTICVATSLLNPCKPFMDLWYQINHQFPDYKIHIVPFDDDHEGILSVISELNIKYDFLVGIFDSPQWLERCSYYTLGGYRRCYAVPAGHRLAKKKTLRLQDLYGETVMIPKPGILTYSDLERAEIEENHSRIKIIDGPSFYDMEVFNRCIQTGTILSSIECWKDIHPSLVTIPIDEGNTIPYVLMFALDPPEDILAIVEAMKMLGTPLTPLL